MAVQTSAGARLAIVSGAPATYDSAGFGALSYTDVGEVEAIGEFGGSSSVITFTALQDIVVRKFKGAFDAGSITLGLGQDRSDAGQAIMVTGAAPDNNNQHSVRVTLSDNTIFYFTCLVFSYTNNVADVNSIVMTSAQLELDNRVIVV